MCDQRYQSHCTFPPSSSHQSHGTDRKSREKYWTYFCLHVQRTEIPVQETLPPADALFLLFYFSGRKFSLLLPCYPWYATWTWGKMLLPMCPSQTLILPLPPQSDAPAKSAECLFTAPLTGVKHESNISWILPAGWPTTSKSLLFTADLIWERWGPVWNVSLVP